MCGTIKPQQASWFHVTEGKKDAGEWIATQHWCPSCMELVKTWLKETVWTAS